MSIKQRYAHWEYSYWLKFWSNQSECLKMCENISIGLGPGHYLDVSRITTISSSAGAAATNRTEPNRSKQTFGPDEKLLFEIEVVGSSADPAIGNFNWEHLLTAICKNIDQSRSLFIMYNFIFILFTSKFNYKLQKA